MGNQQNVKQLQTVENILRKNIRLRGNQQNVKNRNIRNIKNNQIYLPVLQFYNRQGQYRMIIKAEEINIDILPRTITCFIEVIRSQTNMLINLKQQLDPQELGNLKHNTTYFTCKIDRSRNCWWRLQGWKPQGLRRSFGQTNNI